MIVFGNKGSTDQHSYVQQLRDGSNNYFATFIEVLLDQHFKPTSVEPNLTSGDYLNGFFLGTREALSENNRESVTITIREVSPFTVGALIAVFERAVGFYASLINVNAYHQPGVEAGKAAASEVLEIQRRVLELFATKFQEPMTAEEIATLVGAEQDVERVFKIFEHFASNPYRGLIKVPGSRPTDAKYRKA